MEFLPFTQTSCFKYRRRFFHYGQFWQMNSLRHRHARGKGFAGYDRVLNQHLEELLTTIADNMT